MTVYYERVLEVPIYFNVPKQIKVELKLGSDTVKTGQNVDVRLSASENSICAWSAIDKSVTFMGQRNAVDFDSVFAALSQFELAYDGNHYRDTDDCACRSFINGIFSLG